MIGEYTKGEGRGVVTKRKKLKVRMNNDKL